MTKKIIISLAQQTLKAYNGGAVVFDFRCVTGDARHRTPRGNFTVLAKYAKCKNTELDAQMNYALKLTTGGICIHESYIVETPFLHTPNYALSDSLATNVSLARATMPWTEFMNREFQKNINLMGSHGCIRLGHTNAVQLFSWAIAGMPVTIM